MTVLGHAKVTRKLRLSNGRVTVYFIEFSLASTRGGGGVSQMEEAAELANYFGAFLQDPDPE